MNSKDCKEQARVGECRAVELDGSTIDDDIVRLMVETDDVGVTYRVATALLGRGDVLGLRHVLRAAAEGDDQINDVVGDVFLRRRADTAGAMDQWLEAALDDLAQTGDPDEAAAARDMRSWIFSS